MITFWLIGAVMVGIALAFVLPTLMGQSTRQDEPASREAKEANVEVYRDQLAELERDLSNGIISLELYEQDRDELERRLLEDVSSTGNKISESARAMSHGREGVYAVALGLPVLAIILYLQIGNPNSTRLTTGSQPLPQASTTNSEFSQQRIEANVAALAKRLEQNPDDLQGWTMLARSYASLEKYNEATSAYAKATALKTDDADLWADYAFALAMAQGQKLAGEPAELIDKALKLDAENPKALELAGSAAFEAKDYNRAIDYWERLMKKVPANSEVGQSLAERINEARRLAAR